MSKTIYEECDNQKFEVVIPTGFHWVEGDVANGCVIQNGLGDELLRIPLGYTAKGLFVRGFWLSRYEVSKGDNGEPRSIPGKYPWTNISYQDAEIATEKIGASLITGEEYDRIPIWLLSTNSIGYSELFHDGNGLGNFSEPFKVAKTGSNPNWMINRLDSFWGNCYTWTTEHSELYDHHMVVRGGHGSYNGLKNTPICRRAFSPTLEKDDISFRFVFRDKRLNDD
jgi:hypothetical protein